MVRSLKLLDVTHSRPPFPLPRHEYRTLSPQMLRAPSCLVSCDGSDTTAKRAWPRSLCGGQVHEPERGALGISHAA